MQNQRRENIIPLSLIVLCGGTALVFIIFRLGLLAFSQWFLYPSLFFFIFALLRLFKPATGKSDRNVWKACQWWSGIWLLWFALGFCAIPFSIMLWLPLASISAEGLVNPFLALLLHLFIWSCASDLLKTINTAPSLDLPTDQ
jgi:hypothetical protein